MTSMKMSRVEHEALRKLAAREQRTMSGQLRYIIQTLAAEQPENEAA